MSDNTTERARKTIARAVELTDHSSLAVGDTVVSVDSDLALMITAIDEVFATVFDGSRSAMIPVTELGHSEVLRMEWMKELYGDNLITIQAPKLDCDEGEI